MLPKALIKLDILVLIDTIVSKIYICPVLAGRLPPRLLDRGKKLRRTSSSR